MGILSSIKRNRTFRYVYNAVKNGAQFYKDSISFNKFYNNSFISYDKMRYRIMVLVHKLEKGMCHDDLRPFGVQAVNTIISTMKSYPIDKQGDFEYQLACSALKSWERVYCENNWVDRIDPEVLNFIRCLNHTSIEVGCKKYRNPFIENQSKEFSSVILSRHSVRDYEPRAIDDSDIDFALQCFSAAPTACNRQMCKVYRIVDDKKKKILVDNIYGIDGCNKDTLNFFVVTFDLASIEHLGERYQGFLNAGLTAMNFVNGLHSRGIGSCFLQWANKDSEDREVRRELSLSESERIGVVIAAGYYKDKCTIPCSVRKNKSSIYQEI